MLRLTRTDEVDPSVEVLVELLQADDLESRLAAAIALAEFDKRARAAIPALRENNQYAGKPPFTNWTSYQSYRLKNAADSALKAIE